MADATLSANLNFGVVGETVTGQIAVVSPYAASSVGQVDVADGTLADVAFVLPLGAIAAPKSLLVNNTNSQEMAVIFNDGEAATFNLPPGGVLLIAMPTAPADGEVTGVSVVTTDVQVDDGYVEYAFFGD